MEMISPRAATGMLEEAALVAAFTTPFGLTLGASSWPESEVAGRNTVRHRIRQFIRWRIFGCGTTPRSAVYDSSVMI
jgi:hypothetical protein